jgi:hypothetical protein
MNYITYCMKNKKQVYITLLATAAITTAIFLLVRKNKQQKRRLAVISDAGYETAHDMHFPLKINRLKKRRP